MGQQSRRALLRDGVLSIGPALAGTSIFTKLGAQLNSSQADNNGHTLVVLQLAGGNDGLNAVIPYTDPIYAQSRPTIGIPRAQVVPLTGTLGLHPQLAGLLPLWQAGHMAVVENVGYPNPNLSHFQSTYIWQTLDLTGAQGTAQTGWLGHYIDTLDTATQNPFTGFDSGTTALSAAFMSPNLAVPAISNPQAFAINADATDKGRADQRKQDMLSFYQSFAGGSTSSSINTLLNTTAQTSNNASQLLAKAVAAYKPTVTYPAQSSLASSLQLIATALTQGLNVRVGYTTIGGFDTHANEAKTIETLYKEVSDAIVAFFQDLTNQGVANNVVLMTWSEFGRRVHENGSQGTDHGTKAPLFVVGPGVKGGSIYGGIPNLSHLDSTGNLVFDPANDIDFRSVYSTLLSQWLGADATTILGQSFSDVGFIR